MSQLFSKFSSSFFTVKGRVSPTQYYSHFLFLHICSCLLTISYFSMIGILFITFISTFPVFIVILILVTLPILIETFLFIPLTIRRLHDLNLSGWWVIVFILLSPCVLIYTSFSISPYIGDFFLLTPFIVFLLSICSLIFLLRKGTKVDNRFGAIPEMYTNEEKFHSKVVIVLQIIILLGRCFTLFCIMVMNDIITEALKEERERLNSVNNTILKNTNNYYAIHSHSFDDAFYKK